MNNPIKLVPVPRGNENYLVWDWFPQLNTIWSSLKHRYYCREATKEFQLNLSEKGNIFLVTHLYDFLVIGLTGYCPIDKDRVFLRWHGIIPDFRGMGISTNILNLLLAKIKENGYTTVYETTESEKVRDYFIKQGFEQEEDPSVIEEILREAGMGTFVLKKDFVSLG